jgi:thiol-disulfide isomerase/thioredoxin
MNKNYILIAVVALAVILGVGWYAYSERGVVMDDGAASGNSMDKPEGAMMDKQGSYEAYAPEKLALANDGKVVLFFRASWCPTCRVLDADIRGNLGNIPEGVAILDVNYDTATELKQKYGVTYQHTLVQVDAEGNQIAKWTGSPTLAALLGQVE